MTTYQLSNIKQLIDLNGDLTNFNLEFDVKATNGETFEALVVTQETLDTNQSLSYQEAKGSISGSINSDKGIYQNYFLILRADKPTEVIVTLNIEPLGDLTSSALDETNQIHQQHMQQHMTTKKKSWFVRNRIYLFIFFASVCLLVGLYFLLKDLIRSSNVKIVTWLSVLWQGFSVCLDQIQARSSNRMLSFREGSLLGVHSYSQSRKLKRLTVRLR